MNVEEIRTRIKDTYKSFSSYQDVGVIRKNQKNHGWFRTYYLKPNQLLLEWSEYSSGDEFVLMVRGEKAQFRHKTIPQKMKPIKKRADIEKIMHVHLPASMTAGVTSGMSDTILPLLLERTDRPCLVDKKLVRLSDEIVDGEPCFLLRVVDYPTRVWVSQKDFTVRRYETDEHPILDDILRPTMKALGFISDLLYLRTKRPPTSADSVPEDWLFQKVRYNHLDESSFPKFDFERD